MHATTLLIIHKDLIKEYINMPEAANLATSIATLFIDEGVQKV